MMANLDRKTVDSFGDEWSRYSQGDLSSAELNELFDTYFHIFPWDKVSKDAVGFDMGCGSGRWASLVAPRVLTLNCIDPASEALAVARRNLSALSNVNFINAGVSESGLPKGSQDFGYCLGVLHHIPDTAAAMGDCVELLKPGAPFLLYIYYRFDNKPPLYKALWSLSELIRGFVSRMPNGLKSVLTDFLAYTVYFPLARASLLAESRGVDVNDWPLSSYRKSSIYTMRTDSRDRFGTPLEQRFTRVEITAMMEACGLENIRFSETVPFWCAVGTKRP